MSLTTQSVQIPLDYPTTIYPGRGAADRGPNLAVTAAYADIPPPHGPVTIQA